MNCAAPFTTSGASPIQLQEYNYPGKKLFHSLTLRLSSYIEETKGMRAELEGFWVRFLTRLYREGRPLPDDDRHMSKLMSVDPRVWRRIKIELVNLGKLTLRNGAITCESFETERQRRAEQLRKQAAKTMEYWEERRAGRERSKIELDPYAAPNDQAPKTVQTPYCTDIPEESIACETSQAQTDAPPLQTPTKDEIEDRPIRKAKGVWFWTPDKEAEENEQRLLREQKERERQRKEKLNLNPLQDLLEEIPRQDQNQGNRQPYQDINLLNAGMSRARYNPPSLQQSQAAPQGKEINPATTHIIKTIASWMNPLMPDEKIAKSWLQTSVTLYGADVVRDSFADLEARVLNGDIIARPIPLMSRLCQARLEKRQKDLEKRNRKPMPWD